MRPSYTSSSSATPIWLDCDPGHDDVVAILLSAFHPALKLLGLSTVHGNASLKNTTHNASRVLTALGLTDIPIYPGARKPFCRRAAYAPSIHGATGLDGTTLLPKPGVTPRENENYIVAMRDALLAQPRNSAWVVTTGTLTNVAILFAAFPEVVDHIKGLSIMGGAIGDGFSDAPLGVVKGEGPRVGNWTRWAEFNIYCDPEAAQSIFTNPVLAAKTTLIPLDLTHQVLATPEVLQLLLHGPSSSSSSTGSAAAAGESAIKPKPSGLRQLLYDLLTYFAHTYAEVFGLTAGPPLHDPLAVAATLPAAVLLEDAAPAFDDRGGERWFIDVVTDGLHSNSDQERGQVGRTIARKLPPGEPGVTVPRTLDVPKFWEVLEHCIHRAESSAIPELRG
ncbi:Inosine/uridine-preferring nucleoside hydrolase [Xylona heveae TC161]|uniref:Inosine/uridine-preferring nucleoside hydrolase n=1 Tax=Xylona heveae (strain CBS 132557 / TC161) TaxID=1328760 RepID=A0A165GI50_XYLHT|nr:Inosine/uridine-preferring nucleoside hydrolase [Xylona heveae TC161]KZF22212.1 Inosine/uridine-preferring nucleoside hydrolase [Xylona heveae TC161]